MRAILLQIAAVMIVVISPILTAAQKDCSSKLGRMDQDIVALYAAALGDMKPMPTVDAFIGNHLGETNVMERLSGAVIAHSAEFDRVEIAIDSETGVRHIFRRVVNCDDRTAVLLAIDVAFSVSTDGRIVSSSTMSGIYAK